jgi:hypothetical protein
LRATAARAAPSAHISCAAKKNLGGGIKEFGGAAPERRRGIKTTTRMFRADTNSGLPTLCGGQNVLARDSVLGCVPSSIGGMEAGRQAGGAFMSALGWLGIFARLVAASAGALLLRIFVRWRSARITTAYCLAMRRASGRRQRTPLTRYNARTAVRKGCWRPLWGEASSGISIRCSAAGNISANL